MATSVSVRPVTTRGQLRRFIRFPWNVYRGAQRYENWVPPLLVDERTLFNPNKHPFYKHAEMQTFLAYRDSRIVGRIAGIVDRQYIESRKQNTGYFGFFESFDDPEVATAMFETVAEWQRGKGMNKVIGPVNPTPNHILGLLIDNFDVPPVLQTPYNPPYYVGLYEQWGLTKEEDHYAYYLHRDTLELSEKVIRVNELARKRGKITFRPVNMKNFAEEVEIIRYLWNEAWKENADHVPWTKDEFLHMAQDLKLIAIPDLVLLAFVNGEPAGFSIPLPDINEILITMNGRLVHPGTLRLLFAKDKVKTLRLAIMGVIPKFQNMGIDSIFVYETYVRGVKIGFEASEMSLILESNLKLRNLLEAWGCSRYKTYRVYQKGIG